ncbi:hypothetical protein [Pseudoruegeria sp. SHC-113]|uniref:hypothetical protein n=1 Tax=Pseudoruegeria sp. SHC-113 TaxID=2855439 RepID=UPI0021BB14BB|nr:hypothetical protein [Pseudoruegeria sp. SHC-113]MCT8160329.1 hypothetical protein [Pseudoruegeria sp. SHC-113]
MTEPKPNHTARFAALLAIVILAALITVGVAFSAGDQMRTVAPVGGLLAVALVARLLLFARKPGHERKSK